MSGEALLDSYSLFAPPASGVSICEHQMHKGYPFPSPDPACTWVLVSSCDSLACWGSSSAAVSTLVARLSFPGDH